MQIQEVTNISALRQPLQELLANCVDSGASVGFLAPADSQEVTTYWDSVAEELISGQRRLWLAVEGEEILGAIQLALCSKANGAHRGEVEKLMVHTRARGRGISKHLMAQMEACAVQLGLTLLVLDTRQGDIASSLYRNLGYCEAGQIPQFARSSNGKLDATVLFYKLLKH